MIGATLACLFFASTAYAMFLQMPKGRRIAARKSWVTVVASDAMTLIALAVLIPFDSWLIAAAAFAVAGIPSIVRCLYNEMADEEAGRREIEG